MTPFEKLVNEYNAIKYQTFRLGRKKQELELSNGFPAKMNDGMPKTRSNSSAVENTVIKISELESQLLSLQKKLENKGIEITNAIDICDDLYVRKIVELKTFTSRITWRRISMEVGYGEDYCSRLYNKAIEEINTYLSQKEGNL